MSFVPFPTGLLPRPLSTFISDAAAAIGCDECFIAVPLLCACASAIGNSRRVRLKKTWTEPAVLWGAIISPSGTMKSAPIELAVQWIKKQQQRHFKAHADAMEEYEDEHRRWKLKPKNERGEEPAPPAPMEHTYTSDITVEALADRLEKSPRGVLVAVDELAGWFSSFDKYKNGGGDVANWLSMHRASPVKIDRKTGDRPTLFIPYAAVSVTGGIQPRTLRRVLSEELFENGLVSRLLLAMPPVKPKQWNDGEVSDATLRAMELIFDNLYSLKLSQNVDGSPSPADVELTDGARAIFIDFFNNHNREQSTLPTEDLAAAWSKLEGYAARLALIIHCVRQAAGEIDNGSAIDVVSIEAGIALSKWFGGETKRVYAELSADETERQIDELSEIIFKAGGIITARELTRCGRRYRQAGAANAALELMIANGMGQWEFPRPTVVGGKPQKRFRLKPTAYPADKAGDNTTVSDINNAGTVAAVDQNDVQ